MGKTSDGQSRSPQLSPIFQSQVSKYGSRYGSRWGLGLLTIASVLMPGFAAMAQTATPAPTLDQTFQDTYYSNAGTFWGNRSIGGSLSLILGIPGFPDNQIAADGRRVDRLYREVLEQQVSSDPTIRTPDLPNPFSGSLLTTPLIAAEEPIPPAPPPVVFQQPGFVPTPTTAPARTTPARPVPALW